jgi:hypothetical protein
MMLALVVAGGRVGFADGYDGLSYHRTFLNQFLISVIPGINTNLVHCVIGHMPSLSSIAQRRA